MKICITDENGVIPGAGVIDWGFFRVLRDYEFYEGMAG